MALGCCNAVDSQLAVATTGVAGPGPVADVPAGIYCVAVASPNRLYSRRFHAAGDRAQVRLSAVSQALSMLHAELTAQFASPLE